MHNAIKQEPLGGFGVFKSVRPKRYELLSARLVIQSRRACELRHVHPMCCALCRMLDELPSHRAGVGERRLKPFRYCDHACGESAATNLASRGPSEGDIEKI
jgi:hypothetical protein